MKDTDTPPVQHIGEFVLTKNGNLDFGEISSEIGDFYDVQTGYPSRKSGKNKKPLLWECQSERS